MLSPQRLNLNKKRTTKRHPKHIQKALTGRYRGLKSKGFGLKPGKSYSFVICEGIWTQCNSRKRKMVWRGSGRRFWTLVLMTPKNTWSRRKACMPSETFLDTKKTHIKTHDPKRIQNTLTRQQLNLKAQVFGLKNGNCALGDLRVGVTLMQGRRRRYHLGGTWS